jgi:DNA (cytosine-5)-methyltransferase 1
MGFPDDFIVPVSDTQAYKLFGNSVIVPVMKEVACIMVTYISREQKKSNQDMKYAV